LSAHPRAFDKFLEGIQIANPQFPSTVTKVIAFIEPDFANTGFGHPDAVLKLETNEDEVVVILEAKRGCYLNSCKPVSLRGIPRSGYNSSLNGQLELDFALALALNQFQENDCALTEPEWIVNTPYSTERHGGRRTLKNRNVLRAVVKEIYGLPLENYFFVTLTSDLVNPYFVERNTQFLPELFHTEYGKQNCWHDLKHQFGWINYRALESIILSLLDENVAISQSLFLESMELNRKNMPNGRVTTHSRNGMQLRGSRGTSLIYAPTIRPATFLHFSWWDESCALRDYSLHSSLAPIPQRDYETSQVRLIVKREITMLKEAPISDVAYWHSRISELNKSLLVNE
jgi:hypothetical protein